MPDRPKAEVPEVTRERRAAAERATDEAFRGWSSVVTVGMIRQVTEAIERALAEAEHRGPESGRGAGNWRTNPLCHTGDDGILSIEWIESQPGPRHSVFVDPDGSVYWVSTGRDFAEHGEVRGATEAGRGGEGWVSVEAQWALKCLDAWAAKFIEREWSCLINGHTAGRYDAIDSFVCALRDLSVPSHRAFAGHDPDAARIAAARALYAEDPKLPAPPESR